MHYYNNKDLEYWQQFKRGIYYCESGDLTLINLQCRTMCSHWRVQLALNKIEEQNWYAGPISERKAEEILTRLGSPGVFLLRDSLLPEADFVLSVLGDGQISHYPVSIGEKSSCTLNNYTFDDVPTAVDFYCENRISGVFLQPPSKSIVNKEMHTAVKSQPLPIQHPKPITTAPPIMSKTTPPIFYPLFKTSPAHLYGNKEPKPSKSSPLSSPVRTKRNVKFNTMDSGDEEDSTTEESIVRYRTESGSIYTVPNKRNALRGVGKEEPSRPQYQIHSDGQSITSESSNGAWQSTKSFTSFKSKKAMFEQFSTMPSSPAVKKEMVKFNSLQRPPDYEQLEEKQTLHTYKSSETLSDVVHSPPSPPPVPNRSAKPKPHLFHNPPPPVSMPQSFSSPNLFQLDNELDNDLDEEEEEENRTKMVRPTVMNPDPGSYQVQGTKLLGWGGHGPTIAVPTAILAAVKLNGQDHLEVSDEFSDLSDDYSPAQDSMHSRLAIPTAILAGKVPVPPQRVESSQCSPFKKRPFVYDNSSGSYIEMDAAKGDGRDSGKGSVTSGKRSVTFPMFEEDGLGIQRTRSNTAPVGSKMSRLKGILGLK